LTNDYGGCKYLWNVGEHLPNCNIPEESAVRT
jgi:hypothetical protein